MIQGTLTNFCCIVDGNLFEEVMVICETFNENNNPENPEFYCNIVKATKFFKKLSFAEATTTMVQLGETVFSYLRALVILQI